MMITCLGAEKFITIRFRTRYLFAGKGQERQLGTGALTDIFVLSLHTVGWSPDGLPGLRWRHECNKFLDAELHDVIGL